MKIKLKSLWVLLLPVCLTYTACEKSSSLPSNAVTPKSVSSQIALNLTQTLFGGSGAFDVSGGLSAPSNFAVHTKGKIVNDLNDPGCGLAIDTALAYTYSIGDTSAQVSGSIGFTFNCVNNIVTGFTTADNLNVTLTTPVLTASGVVAENFTVLALNPLDDNSTFSINGTVSSSSSLKYKSTTSKNGSAAYSYKLTSIIIDPTADADIVSGSATFSTTGSGASGVWNYSGTIVFKGNHIAVITINGTAYTVNLQTGIVS
jgi:hypothetical protein